MPTNSGYDPTQPIGAPYGFVGPATLPGTPTSPINSGPQSPFGTSPIGVSPFTSAQQAQLQNALSAAGIWDTIQGLGSDVWGYISSFIDSHGGWEKVAGDIVGFFKNNKDTILQGLSAYNNYERSQKSDAYAQQALAGAKESYDAKAPLRVAGQAGMLNPQGADLSGLKTQGQNGLGIKAPTPLPLATPNLANAQQLVNGPQSGNPFTKALPVAGAAPSIPAAPIAPAPPMRTISPPSHPSDGGPISPPGLTLPLAPNPQLPPQNAPLGHIESAIGNADPGVLPVLQQAANAFAKPPQGSVTNQATNASKKAKTLPVASY